MAATVWRVRDLTPTDLARRAGRTGHGAASRSGRLAAAVVSAALLATGCAGPGADAERVQATGTGPAGQQPTPAASPEPSVPAPHEHSTVGDLPADFPRDLLPVPAGAEILVATYAPEPGAQAGADQPYAVSLNVRTALPVDDVVALYRSSLTAAGFVESTGPVSGSLTAESTFTRSGGQEIVVVGVLDRDGSRTVTAGGRIRAAA
jgi:hypothetical protein